MNCLFLFTRSSSVFHTTFLTPFLNIFYTIYHTDFHTVFHNGFHNVVRTNISANSATRYVYIYMDPLHVRQLDCASVFVHLPWLDFVRCLYCASFLVHLARLSQLDFVWLDCAFSRIRLDFASSTLCACSNAQAFARMRFDSAGSTSRAGSIA